MVSGEHVPTHRRIDSAIKITGADHRFSYELNWPDLSGIANPSFSTV